MKATNIAQNDDLLKANEVRKLLNISTGTFWKYVNNGMLKSYRIGTQTIRFRRSEVLEILKPNLK